jgi:hypothetical protein
VFSYQFFIYSTSKIAYQTPSNENLSFTFLPNIISANVETGAICLNAPVNFPLVAFLVMWYLKTIPVLV